MGHEKVFTAFSYGSQVEISIIAVQWVKLTVIPDTYGFHIKFPFRKMSEPLQWA